MNQNNIDSWMRRIKKYQLSTNTIINSPGVARVIFTVIVTFAVYPRLVLNRYFSWSAWRIASPVKLKNISTFFSLCPPHGEYFYAVLRIQLILMRIRIRILDPHWKKNGSGSKLLKSYNKAEFLNLLSYVFRLFLC